LQVMVGQQLMPERYHPIVDTRSEPETQQMLAGVHKLLHDCVSVVPDHAEYLAKSCRAGVDAVKIA